MFGEEGRQLLDVTDAGINDLAAGDLLDRANADSGTLGHSRPTALPGLQTLENEVVDGDIHAASIDPSSGLRNPPMGAVRKYAVAVGRHGVAKRRKESGEVRSWLAQNVRRLMNRRYAESTNKPRSLATSSGLTLSSVQRVLDEQTGAGTETIERLARALGVEPSQLIAEPSPQAVDEQASTGRHLLASAAQLAGANAAEIDRANADRRRMHEHCLRSRGWYPVTR